MARPVTGTPALEIVEEAIHALRGAGVRALALAYTGSIPFALGVLLFWRDLTHYSRNTRLCAGESLLLVALLLWMNVWRGVFASEVHAQFSGTRASSSGGFLRLARVHLLLGNSKLVLMPLAAAVVLPLPGAVAFFRIATTVVALDQEDFAKTVAKARKLTSALTQPVLLILLLGFAGLVLFVNISVLLALLPQLVRILTGYESSYTRAGVRLLADPSFYVVAGVLAWLVFDPFAQTVYTLAAFHADSKETGRDIRARFRAMLRSGSITVMLIVLYLPILTAQPRLDASALDRSIQQTLSSPQYGWNDTRQSAPGKESWLVRFTDSLGASLSRVKAAVARAIDRVLEWFRKMFQAPPPQGSGPPASGAIRSELYIGLTLALLAAALLMWRNRAALVRRRISVPAAPPAISLAADGLTADQLPEEGWYLLAEECFSKSQFRLGLRALYLANLAGLAREGWIAIHPGKTNHEYERELYRRVRGFPYAGELFSANVDLFERVWYGDYSVSFEECRAFRDRATAMKRAAGVPA